MRNLLIQTHAVGLVGDVRDVRDAPEGDGARYAHRHHPHEHYDGLHRVRPNHRSQTTLWNTKGLLTYGS